MKSIISSALIITVVGLISCGNSGSKTDQKKDQTDTSSFIANGYSKNTKRPSFLYEMIRVPIILKEKFTIKDSIYLNAITKRFNYKDSVIVYSLTDIKLKCNGRAYNNIVYQNQLDTMQFLIDLTQINENKYYLVVNTNKKSIGIPGTGGISYHRTTSNKHIICLNGYNTSNGVSIDDNMKGGFPTPEFGKDVITWYFY